MSVEKEKQPVPDYFLLEGTPQWKEKLASLIEKLLIHRLVYDQLVEQYPKANRIKKRRNLLDRTISIVWKDILDTEDVELILNARAKMDATRDILKNGRNTLDTTRGNPNRENTLQSPQQGDWLR